MANKNYPKNVSATTVIPFDNPVTYIPQKTVTGALTFTKTLAGAQAGYITIIEVVANGVNVPDVSAFYSMGTGTYDNTSGVVNLFTFAYTGSRAVVSINPISGTGGGADTTPPTLVTASVEAAEPNKVLLSYSESLDTGSVPANGDYTVTVNGSSRTVTGVSVLSTSVKVTFGGAAVVSGNTIGLNYTAGTNPVQDVAGNNAANLSGLVPDNNVSGGGSYTWVDLLFPTLNQNTTITDSTDNTFVPTGNSEWNGKGCEDLKLTSGTDGAIIQQYKSDAKFCVIGVYGSHAIPNSGSTDYSGCLIGAYLSASGAMYKIESGAETSLGASLTVNDWVGIFRSGGTWKIKKSSDKTTWTDLATLSGTPSGDLYPIYYVYRLDAASKGYNIQGSGLV
jgi:hypothetical protein